MKNKVKQLNRKTTPQEAVLRLVGRLQEIGVSQEHSVNIQRFHPPVLTIGWKTVNSSGSVFYENLYYGVSMVEL